MNGILCIDKPQGWTSFDVVAKLRGILHMRRLGHAGTLDPMATGVLPVFVGYATRACGILPDEDKAYTAGFRLGTVTDTQDSTGTVLAQRSFDGIRGDQVQAAFPCGEILQVPPMYSAVKVGGRRLYELAREGKETQRPARPVTVYTAQCTAFDPVTGQGTVSVRCGRGTYVRTLIHDMGQALGCGAVMTALRRDSACGFSLADCHTLDAVQQAAAEGCVQALLVPTAQAFAVLPRVQLDTQQTGLYRNGVKLPLSSLSLPEGERFAVYGEEFLGTATADREGGILRIERNLHEPE